MNKDGVSQDKQDAQLRADQIRAFQAELKLLQADEVLDLSEESQARIQAYHGNLLLRLSSQFDVDTSHAQKRLSWGMRIASFMGALAISAAVFFFFYRFWGLLSTTAQVALLIAAPLIMTGVVEWVARREKRGLYFTSLSAMVAFACFVLNLSVLGSIFNITPSENAFLVWAIYGLVLAYTYDLKLLLVAALTSLMGYLASIVGTWSGAYWLSFGQRPENFIVAGLLLFAGGMLVPDRKPIFAGIFRVYGLLSVLIAMLILSNWGEGSYLPWNNNLIEGSYQTLGFVGSGLAIWLGIRRHWPGLVNLGSTFFVIFMFTKLFDWWWDWMPKYLFFLMVGLVAILLLLGLRRLRSINPGGAA